MSKIKNLLKEHFVDSTAVNGFFMPVGTALENLVVGMTDEISLKSRLYSAAITYGGLGSLTRLMKLSRKKFGAVKGGAKFAHDAVFVSALTLGIRPFVYLAAGETDWKKIALGTLLTGGFALATGGPLGYYIDAFRDLTGLEEFERVPELIRYQSPSTKKTLAAVLTVASIATMLGIYSISPK